jgi:D-3-phosphoglycerate dehydrogenase
MWRILVTELVAEEGLDVLRGEATVDINIGPTTEHLSRVIGSYDGLLVRSKTRVTADLIAAGARLGVIGRVGTGVDNVDLDAATRRGIVVVNAPYGNTVSVAEHTLAMLLALARHIPRADASVRGGRWEKQAFEGVQLRGKVLGIVGLGRVGAAVARRALGLEMRVICHDPLVTPERAAQMGVQWAPFEELLCSADIISLHLPDSHRMRALIGELELALVKSSAYLINCARGSLVDGDALYRALQSGRLAGAALDVFPQEPPPDSPLLHCDRVILTPHLAGSTAEAQRDTAVEVAQQVLDVLAGRMPKYPVNAPALPPEELQQLGPYLDLARRLGAFYAQVAGNHIQALEVACTGEQVGQRLDLLVSEVLVGLLAGAAEEPINWINAQWVARERGIAFAGRLEPESSAGGWANWIELRVGSPASPGPAVGLRTTSTAGSDRCNVYSHRVAGAVLRGEPHIVRVDDYWLDFVARGLLLVSEHIEQPGILGRMGTVLGNAGVNIHFVQVGRRERGGPGLLVLGLDDQLTPEVLNQVLSLPSIRSARMVKL